MNILKLKTKILIIAIIILLLGSCYINIEFESKEKRTIKKEIEEVFSKIKTIDFSDFYEDFSEGINNHHWVKENRLNKYEVRQETNYLNEIIIKNKIVKEGDTLVDLGSGFGIECLLLRQIIIGNQGKVIGVDIDESFNIVARKYSEYLGYNNVDFILSDIRELPLDDNIADVVISNYTLTLISEKEKVFSEIFRILKNGGNCYIGDAVIYGNNFDLLEKIKNDTLYSNYYINRSISKDEYFNILKKIGFKNIKIKIKNIDRIDEEGNIYGVEHYIDKFRFRKKIISSGAYIYAEKS